MVRPWYDPPKHVASGRVRDWGHQHVRNQNSRYRYARGKANLGTIRTAIQGAYGAYKLGKSVYNFFSSKSSNNSKKAMPPTRRSRSRSRSASRVRINAGTLPVGPSRILSIARTGRGATVNNARRYRARRSGQYKITPGTSGSGSNRGIDHQKVTKKLPRARKGIEQRIIKNGIQGTRESGGVVNTGANSSALYIGHATCPIEVMRSFIWCSLVKTLLIKAGHTVPALNVDIQDLSNDDRISLIYKADSNTASTIATSTLLGIGGRSVLAIAAYLASEGEGWNGVDHADAQNVIFEKIVFIPDSPINGARAEIVLTHSKIEMYIRQEMKLQNRSVAEEGDDEMTRVDNVPLYMHCYGAHGNSFEYIQKFNDAAATDNMRLVADESDGLIQVGNHPFAEEPPSAKELSAKYYKKSKLQPGEIEESKLKYHKTVMFNRIFRLIGSSNTNGVPKVNIGEARLFAFDKMIETIGPGGTGRKPISIAYEINSFFAFQFKNGYNNTTTQLYSYNGVIASG